MNKKYKVNKELEEKRNKLMERKELNYPKEPIELTDDNFDEMIRKYPLIVVDLWAAYCPPCRIMGPIIDDLAKKYQGKIVFGKLDTTKNRTIPMKFGVNAIPTLLIFKNGKLVDRIIGLKPKPVLESELKKYI